MPTRPLMCSLCPFVQKQYGVVEPAVFIVRGYSVCDKHVGYVAQGTEFSHIVAAINEPTEAIK